MKLAPLLFCCVLLLAEVTSLRRRPKNKEKKANGFSRDREIPSRSNNKKRLRSRRPNIILMLSDDQDVLLGSMQAMPFTKELLGRQGVELINSFVSSPMCCPSRSSILTGLHVHNHHVYTNNDNCSSTQWRETHETKTFATYLKNFGRYNTGYFGKYLNEYDGRHTPPGWSEWLGLIKNSRFYNYRVSENGKIKKYKDDYSKDYFTDVVANKSLAFFRTMKRLESNTPVMMVLSFPAPHGPEDSAPQYQHLYKNNTDHMTPSYNYAPNPDKQWLLQRLGRLAPVQEDFTRLLQQKRLQTLRSVDDAVKKVVDTLREIDELDNTYIIYTSDHGYHLGQFGLTKGKSFPFDFDVRVPLFVRGPGIKPGVKMANMIQNIDHAPTLLDMANVPVPHDMDGRSYLPLLRATQSARGDGTPEILRPTEWRDTLLLERGKISQKKIGAVSRIEADRNQVILQNKNNKVEEYCKNSSHFTCSTGLQWVCWRDKSGRSRISKCSSKCHCDNNRQIVAEIPNKPIYERCKPSDNSSSTSECTLDWQVARETIRGLERGLRDHRRKFSKLDRLNTTAECDCNRFVRNPRLFEKHKRKRKRRNRRKKAKTSGQSTGFQFEESTARPVNFYQDTKVGARLYTTNGAKIKYNCTTPGMICDSMDNDHFKTPPLWTGGPFCFCRNSVENTYWCLRTINSTHDFLFCAFVSDFLAYYDLRTDPHQLQNIATSIDFGVRQQLYDELLRLKPCKGHECFKLKRPHVSDRHMSSADRRRARRHRHIRALAYMTS